MSDMELLQSAQLFQRDYQSGKEGFTLAAVLLLGDDQVILSVLPHHRTDALLRRENIDRYDDRDDIRTNLIESYDRLMAFVAKHLPDKFFLEKDQRISLRDHIFREVAANMLIHREFLNPYPAKLIIETHRLFAENSNKPHGHGLIDPANFSPFPKNPVIARFFKEIGRADELGSGVRNLFKYCRHYEQVGKSAKIIEFCKTPKSASEIMDFLGLKHREHFRAKIIQPLLKQGLLKPTIPDKPTSSKQKYYATKEKKIR
jgi:ATP-dependent DNA helicase RecG